MRNLIEKIFKEIKDTPDNITAYEDMYYICKEIMKDDINTGVGYLKELSDFIECTLPTLNSYEDVRKLFDIHKRVLLASAPYDFESYLLYVEWNREPKAKFYPPRRKILKQIVEALQELADDKLDLLAVSVPPGCGKTTLAIFYLTWCAGRIPNEPMLTGSHSNSFVRGVYDECLRILDSNGEYLWHDVFPHLSVSKTNAKDCRIDIDRTQRFETLEFTSIGTGNAGLYRASTLLYCDDLVSGLEIALSNERLDKLWETYTTDLRQRKIGDHCKELHIATRWAREDIIGRLEMQYGDSDRAKFISIPAVNNDDESNFDYAYGVGFSTNFYREQREIMDEVSWRALYMNEPIERYGLCFPSDELRRYFDLPDREPDTILAVCDTKDKGKDYCVLPVFYVYGDDYYLVETICDNGLPDTVDVRLVDILYRHKVRMCRFESNSAGGRVAKETQANIKEKGGITHITTKYTTQNKETRIISSSAWVKEHILFKDTSTYKRGSEYARFMDFVTSYTIMGKNKFDDTVDALSMFADFAISLNGNKVEIFKKPW